MNEDTSGEVSIDTLLHRIPEPEVRELPTHYSERIGDWYSNHLIDDVKGQVFTPQSIAKFMANRARIKEREEHVLDPGTWIGILGCAVVEELAEADVLETIFLDVVES